MNRTILANIMDDGPDRNKFFTDTWNEMLASLQALKNVNHLQDFSDYVLRKLTKMFQQYRPVQLLYDLETGRNMLVSSIESFGPELITEAISLGLMSDSYWNDFDTLGDITNTSNSKVNYTGFGLTNQQGQYSSNEAKAVSSGSTSRLQHITFLQNFTVGKCEAFVEKIKRDMFQLIY